MSSDIELIGEGGYGCVIQPPVVLDRYSKTYVEYTDRSSKDIGKLFLEKKHFVEELKLLKGIQQIDRESTFTVKLKGANVFNSDLLNDTVLKCLDSYTNTEVYQITMEYGGKDLHKLSAKSMPFKYFIKYFKTLIEGLIKLHSYNMIHYDIKPSNILVSQEKISLIDFGISISTDKMYSSENRKRLSDFYIYHAPESFIASLLLDYKGSHSSFQNRLDTVIDDMIEQEYFENIWEENKIEMVKEELSDFIDQIKSNDFSFNEVFNKEMAFKCDIYSMHFVVKEFSSKIIYDNDMQKEFIRELYSMCSSVNPYKRASSGRILEFLKESEKTLSRSSNNQIGGSKTRLRFPKLHKDTARLKSQEPPLKYKLPQVVNKHLKKQ